MRIQTNLNTISIKPIEIFGDLVLLAQSERLGNRLCNRKMKPAKYVGDFIQYTILPLEFVILGELKGQGTLAKAQEIACAHGCEFRVIHSGGCYVNHELRTAIKSSHKHFFKGEGVQVVHLNPMIRLSVWGDVGRLNEEGKAHVLSLINASSKRLAYTADFDREDMQGFKGSMLASVQTSQRVDLALAKGWKMYISTVEALKRAKQLGLRLYNCPQNNKGDAVLFGCSTCPIQCNGERHVVSHGLRHKL